MNHRNSLAKAQLEHNRITRDDWQTFAPHRMRMTELLLSVACSDHPSLCILGAGNGNDIDLSLLTDHFERITLVDLDGEALDHCLARQPPGIAARIELIAGADLSGILALLDTETARPLSSQQVQEAAARARHPRPGARMTQYDVVASCCLLTQMIDAVVQRLGPDHPQFAALALAVRDGHLKLLGELTAAGGTGLLITDFVSSDTLPELLTVPETQLEHLLVEAINGGNFFTGANPAVLAQRLAEEFSGSSRPHNQHVQLHPPWKWQMGNRCYGVCAVAMTKDC